MKKKTNRTFDVGSKIAADTITTATATIEGFIMDHGMAAVSASRINKYYAILPPPSARTPK